MNQIDLLLKTTKLKGLCYSHLQSEYLFAGRSLSANWLPFKQPRPLMTVLQAQLEWNVADTGTEFNSTAQGTQNKWLNSRY